jgi:hypothetical protein
VTALYAALVCIEGCFSDKEFVRVSYKKEGTKEKDKNVRMKVRKRLRGGVHLISKLGRYPYFVFGHRQVSFEAPIKELTQN